MENFTEKVKSFFKSIENRQVLKDIVLIACCVAVFIIGYIPVVKHKYNKTNGKFEIYEEKMTLKYNAIKCQLVDEVDRYIDSIAQSSALEGIVVVDNCLLYDIDICFVLAQGQKESHFGTQGMARKTNSVWNVFAFDGHKYEDICKNGKYNSPNQSVKPYMDLLTSNYLVDKTEYDLLTEYVDKNGKRYASAEDYEKSLYGIYNRIRTETHIEEYAQELKRYKILLGE